MSEPFDPEKVVRFTGHWCLNDMTPDKDGEWVSSEDYDKLLAQNRLLLLLAEQLTRDLCYEGGTLAGSVRMRSYIRQELDLVSQHLHHKPTLEWKSLLEPIPSKSPSTDPPRKF